MKVLVGMSGGVDSSVAALLLKRQGYEVTGVFMKIFSENHPRGVVFHRGGDHRGGDGGEKSACYGPEEGDLQDAEKVADSLKIPLHIIDVRKEYQEHVLQPFIQQYTRGQTPNPCIVCNRHIKFGCLLRKAASSGLDFDFFATGHYARVRYDPEKKRFLLKKALDRKKDQSYFLYYLSQEQLAKALFPLGNRRKAQVRQIARKFHLPVSEKKESQDFLAGERSGLFTGKVQPGLILDKEGRILGRHKGIAFYTVGQRKGLGIAHRRPLYVIRIDCERNALVVGEEKDCFRRTLVAGNLHLVGLEAIPDSLRVKAKIRYGHRAAGAVVHPLEGNRLEVVFDKPQWAVTPGQSVVFYQADTLAAGGVIES